MPLTLFVLRLDKCYLHSILLSVKLVSVIEKLRHSLVKCWTVNSNSHGVYTSRKVQMRARCVPGI